jgi:hypothetical protein
VDTQAGSAATKKEIDLLASVGEAIEGYCATIYEFIFCSYNEIAEKQYSMKDFQFSKPSNDTKMHWKRGYL